MSLSDTIVDQVTDYEKMMGYAQWVCLSSKDLGQDPQVVMKTALTALVALAHKDFKSAAVAFRSAYEQSRAINKLDSDTFTPYEMVLLELILYTEVQSDPNLKKRVNYTE